MQSIGSGPSNEAGGLFAFGNGNAFDVLFYASIGTTKAVHHRRSTDSGATFGGTGARALRSRTSFTSQALVVDAAHPDGLTVSAALETWLR